MHPNGGFCASAIQESRNEIVNCDQSFKIFRSDFLCDLGEGF